MAEFVTGEAARERFRALSDQVDAAYGEMRALSSDEVGNDFRVELAERLETQERTNRGLMYRVFGQIAERRAITARSTTARTGPRAAPPTPTPCSSPAPPTTHGSATATSTPPSPTPAA
jgi:hypothetical protein